MSAIGLNIVLAILLFIINGLLGKVQGLYHNLFEYELFAFNKNTDGNYSGNFFQMVINPAVFVTIVCVILQAVHRSDLCASSWQIVLFFWVIRFLYYLVVGRLYLVNWIFEIVACLLSIGLVSMILFTCILPLIQNEKSIFIPLESLRDAIWFAIIAYIAKTIWEIGKMSLKTDYVFSDNRKERAIKTKCGRLGQKYDTYVTNILNTLHIDANHLQNFKMLVYAVMIYEDYNRPVVFRAVERILKKLRPSKPMTLGIMQVETREVITDEESIRLGIEKLFTAYIEHIDDCPVENAVFDYNPSGVYQSEVLSIFNSLTAETE